MAPGLPSLVSATRVHYTLSSPAIRSFSNHSSESQIQNHQFTTDCHSKDLPNPTLAMTDLIMTSLYLRISLTSVKMGLELLHNVTGLPTAFLHYMCLTQSPRYRVLSQTCFLSLILFSLKLISHSLSPSSSLYSSSSLPSSTVAHFILSHQLLSRSFRLYVSANKRLIKGHLTQVSRTAPIHSHCKATLVIQPRAPNFYSVFSMPLICCRLNPPPVNK